MNRIIKLLKGIFCFFIIFAGLVPIEYNQNITIDDKYDIYRNTQIILKATELNDNQYYNQWTTSFSKNVKILNVCINNNPVKYKIEKQSLKLDLPKVYNNKTVNINIDSQVKLKHDCDFVKEILVYIPEYANGAKCNINIKYPNDLVVYDAKLLKQNNKNLYSWQGIVPSKGIKDHVYLSKKKCKWEIITTITIHSSELIKKLSFKTRKPYYGGINNVLEFNVTNSDDEYITYKEDDKDDDIIMLITIPKLNSYFANCNISAIVENNIYDNYEINIPENKQDEDILSYDYERYKDDCYEKIDIKKLVNKILSSDKNNEANYIKICKWIHNNIKYDLSMAGKNKDPYYILTQRRGVCEHFAILFKYLISYLNIESYVVSGLSYNVKKHQFIPHAWNVVKINDKWIPLDPTWNIYSGILPISHIFTNINFQDKYNGVVSNIEYKSSYLKENPQNTLNISLYAKYLK